MLDAPEFTPPALTQKEMSDQLTALSDKKTPHVFSLKGQLLDQGRTDSVLAATDNLTIRLKIYASGGENELHAHTSEDHSFMILQGSARFFGPDDEPANGRQVVVEPADVGSRGALGQDRRRIK